MPGTESEPRSPGTRAALVAQLIVIGWLLLGGQIGFVLFQMERVRSVDETQFATAWDQRIEVLSFLMLPPNLGALAATAIVAAGTVVLAGRERSPWLDALVRLTAGISIILVFVGFGSIIEIGTRPGALEIDAVFLRLGGMSFCAGTALLCRVAESHAAR